MRYPSETEFLANFGIEPIDHDPQMGSYAYSIRCGDPAFEVRFFFSPIEQDFSAKLLYLSQEITSVFLTNTKSISIFSELNNWYMLIEFAYSQQKIETLTVNFSPNPRFELSLFSPERVTFAYG